MKKLLLGILFTGFILGCGRSDPGGDDKNTENIPELKQVAVYSTAVSEPSGLAYNSKTNSLYTVSDGNSTIYEIDFTGKVLNSFAIASADLEGITFSDNCDTFYVAEETNQKITKYLMNGTKLSSFSVTVATNIKNALEGVTMGANNHLFVLNEKTPGTLLEFLSDKEIYRKTLDYTIDCSDIFYDKNDSSIWMVSDESKLVVKMSNTGALLAKYSIPFYKGEGIAIVGNKIYIVDDSNGKFYIFEKP